MIVVLSYAGGNAPELLTAGAAEANNSSHVERTPEGGLTRLESADDWVRLVGLRFDRPGDREWEEQIPADSPMGEAFRRFIGVISLLARPLAVLEWFETAGGAHWARCGQPDDTTVLVFVGKRGQWMAHTAGWKPGVAGVTGYEVATTYPAVLPRLWGLEHVSATARELPRPEGWTHPDDGQGNWLRPTPPAE